MAAPYSDTASKLEAAMKAVVDALALIDSAGASVPCFPGLDDDPNQTPCVTAKADGGGEVIFQTGNDSFNLAIRVYTRTGGDKGETLAQHRARTAKVFDAFKRDDLASTLSATAGIDDFYVEDTWKTGENETTTNNCFVSELTLECIAMASDVAA